MRAYILGNGPSLLDQASLLPRLASETTFCCNRFVRWEGRPGWTPTYYFCSANAIIKGTEPEAPPYQKTKYLVSRMRAQLDDPRWDGNWVRLYKKEWHPFLGLDPAAEPGCVRGGMTMPGIMVQVAASLGFDDLYLLGVEQRGSGHVFDPLGADPFHYFIPVREKGGSDAWLFENWRTLAEACARRGIELHDCTPGGRLSSEGGLPYRSMAEALWVR